jgi:WD40 repeat protein
VDDDAFVGQVLLTRRRAGAWDAREAPFTMVSRHLSQGDLRQESHGNWFSIGSTVYTDSGRVSTHTALSETQSTSPSEDAIWSPGLLVILDRPSHPVTVDLQDNGYQATFSGAGDFLATDDGTGELGYWSAKSGRFIERLRGHTDFLLDVAVSSNGSVVASVCRDGTVRVWRPKPTP